LNTTYEGKLTGKGLKFALVVGRFNDFISTHLLDGALDNLRRHETADDDIEIAWVPGAFEMPLVAQKLAASGRYDAIICLGAVIRGARRTSTTSPPRPPRGSPRPASTVVYRWCSEC